jgi:hypothetical protein
MLLGCKNSGLHHNSDGEYDGNDGDRILRVQSDDGPFLQAEGR